ncbi:MAG: glycosyltransferase family 4 protein [Pseudomonadota bacterium]
MGSGTAKSILCVHQGTELYGSDRSFVHAVSALASSGQGQPEVLLPGRGEIEILLAQAGLNGPTVRHLWILRKAGLLRDMSLGLPRNIGALRRAIRDLRRAKTVYVNTAVVLDFTLASILIGRRLIVHVREIPTGLALAVLRRLLIVSHAGVIFNSQATAAAFDLPAAQPQRIVHNGYPQPARFEKERYTGDRPLRVLCIGRLNAWKGQDALVEACAAIPKPVRHRFDVQIVGGVYGGQEHFRQRLIAAIAQNGLGGMVRLIGSVGDPSGLYRNADVVVVPSTQPEPFGRVAIEAMAHHCAVVASDHGGLREIVVAGRTGKLIPPAKPDRLKDALLAYSAAPELVCQHGASGHQRYLERFTQDACDAAFLQAFADLEPRETTRSRRLQRA